MYLLGGLGDVHSSLNMALVNVFYNPLFYLVYLGGISLFHLLVGLLSYCIACNAPVLEAKRMLLQQRTPQPERLFKHASLDEVCLYSSWLTVIERTIYLWLIC